MANRKMNKITNGVKVSFYVPAEWHEQMKDLAEKNRIAISDVYRLAIKEFVDRRFVMKVSS
jgi:predicted transcriptional regulator